MALSLQQVQKQTQRLIMTPQMQQSIQLLQMNSMDLEMLVRNEMMENPFLELADDEEALASGPEEAETAVAEAAAVEPESGLSEQAANTADVDPEAYDQDFAPTSDYLGRETTTATPSEGMEPGDPANDAEGSDDFGKFSENDVEWGNDYDESSSSGSAGTKEDVEEHDFTTYTGTLESLYDKLMRQLHLSILGGKDFEIGEFIIGNLNADGYLDATLENQCLMLGYPSELVTPDDAGPPEKVDLTLRRLLAAQHKENPDAFVGMKRKEVIHRIIAELLGETYDDVAGMKREEQLLRLIGRRLKRPFDDLDGTPAEELLLDVIAARMRTTADRVFDVLEVVQEFEPTGIAARSLAECLRLQCEEQDIRNRLVYRILEEHLSDLQQKRFREIARSLEVPEEKVTDVFTILSRLDPCPGRATAKEQPQYITPDVYVKKVDGKYMYYLNEGDAGRLKVAANYRRLMAAKRARGGPQAPATIPPKPPGDAEYAADKYKNAVWLIRNIEKRKSTILRVTEAIMDFQKDFLEKGIEHLRPLTLRDIAERVGMHESTIARVTTKKYVESPRGIFELKFFFSSGLETDDGEAASSRSIKELLTQMIGAEDKRRPLSDQKIADMLRAKGFQIARRTVAKYREQLRILPAKLRKEVR